MSAGSDTIAAIATAPGRGGVAVIRVSGPQAAAIGEALTGRRVEPGRFAFVTVRQNGAVIDQGLLLAFAAPHSYTGEDVVEFQCHGGLVTPRRVLEACISAGARAARRGEFTERAFLNGRLDYDQAEAVLDLIDAKTDRAADVALAGLAGTKQRALRDLYELLLALSSTVEHALDVDEGDLPNSFFSSLQERLADVRARFAQSLRRAREGRLLREGALVVLAGPPNAGKSSLLNALVGENRAIVSSVAGTTRDAIEVWLDLGGWPVRLVDTAGLRAAGADAIEAEGIRRAEALLSAADVVIRLGEVPLGSDERELAVAAKCDLTTERDPSRLAVSSVTGEGLAALRQAIVAKLEARAAVGAADGQVSDQALAALIRAAALLPESTDDLVLAGNALARAAVVLGEPLGATYSADLLEALFSRFCVGK